MSASLNATTPGSTNNTPEHPAHTLRLTPQGMHVLPKFKVMLRKCVVTVREKPIARNRGSATREWGAHRVTCTQSLPLFKRKYN